VITPEEIRTRLEKAFPGAVVQVRDLTGTRDHYEVTIVAEAFKDMTLVERHRMAYAPFRDVIGGALHALSLKTLAPGE
jgi:stress-induced morphogen